MANDLPECCDIKVQSIVHLVGTGLDTDLASTGQASSHSMLQQNLPHTNGDRQRENDSQRLCTDRVQLTVISVQLKHLGNSMNRKGGEK